MLNATENPCIYNDNYYHGFVVKYAFSGSIRVILPTSNSSPAADH